MLGHFKFNISREISYRKETKFSAITVQGMKLSTTFLNGKNVNRWLDGSGEPRPTELVAAM